MVYFVHFLIFMPGYSKYFAVSDIDKTWGMHTLNCGASNVKNGLQFPSGEHPLNYQITWSRGRILNEYQLVYLVDGKGIFQSDPSGEIELKAGSIFLVYPATWHRYKPADNNQWQTYWVGFTGDLADRFIQKTDITKESPVKQIGYQRKIIQIYLDILETSQLEYTGYQQVFVGEIIKLLGLIRAIQRKSEFKQKDIDSIIQHAKIILMQKNLNISIEEVAVQLNMGYSTFRKLFRDYTGISPGKYQMQHKINKAIHLLNEGKYSVKEISSVLGFYSPQYFARIFKKKTGMSPGNFRKGF